MPWREPVAAELSERFCAALKKQGVEEASLLLWKWAHPEQTSEQT